MASKLANQNGQSFIHILLPQQHLAIESSLLKHCLPLAPGSTLAWLFFYLTNSSFLIPIDASPSSCWSLKAGCPRAQFSILFSFLYIYIYPSVILSSIIYKTVYKVITPTFICSDPTTPRSFTLMYSNLLVIQNWTPNPHNREQVYVVSLSSPSWKMTSPSIQLLNSKTEMSLSS